MKLFAASFIPKHLSDKIYEIAKLAGKEFDLKLVASEKMHITYKYFGDADLSQSLNAVEKAVKGIKSFKTSIRGFDCFSRGEYACVLWAGFDDKDGFFKKISGNICGNCDRFKAHVTAARFKNGNVKQRDIERYISENGLQEFCFGSFTVTSVALIESITWQNSTKYKILKNFYLEKENV